jgi:hypothetical protein
LTKTLAAERERWRAALAYAVEEAERWYEDGWGLPMDDPRMAAARALLSTGQGEAPPPPEPFAWATLCDDALHTLSHTKLAAETRAEYLREANRGRGFHVEVVPLYR